MFRLIADVASVLGVFALLAVRVMRRSGSQADQLAQTAPLIRTEDPAPTRTGRRASRPRRLLASTAGVAAGVVVAVSSAGVTYAYLNAQTLTGGATIHSGTFGLTVSGVPPGSFANLIPGESDRKTVTVTSTGDAPASVTVRLAAASPMVAQLVAGACGTVPPATPALTTSAASIGDFAAGQTRSFCLQVTAPAAGLSEAQAYDLPLYFASVQKAS